MDDNGGLGSGDERPGWKWLALGLFALLFFVGLVWLRLPSTQSRWTHVERNGRRYYLQKTLPAAVARSLPGQFPAQAQAWLEARGFRPSSLAGLPPTVIASWGSYASLTADDPLLGTTLLREASSGFRVLASLSQELRLNEPVVSTYVTLDGAYLFIDMRHDDLSSEVHALSHVLARRHQPLDLSYDTGLSPDPVSLRAWAYLDEATALFLGDLAASVAPAKEGLGAYAAYVAERYNPTGPLYEDSDGAFLFSSEEKGPDDYAAMAQFFLGLCRDKGFERVEAWSLAFIQGDYLDLKSHCASLGLDLATLP